MNGIRLNFFYVALIVIAIVLVVFTLVLQFSIQNLGADNPASENQPIVVPSATSVAPTVIQAQQQPTTAIAAPTEPPAAPTVAPAAAQSQPADPEPAEAEAALSPEELLELEMLGAANLTTSEEDDILVQLIENNPTAIGFIRYSSYLRNQDSLRALKILSVDTGVAIEPNEDTVASGAYPFSRPLLLYTSADAVQNKSSLEGYIGCYLNQIFDEVEGVGYTPPSLAMYRDALENFNASCENCQMAGSTNPLFPTVPACTVDNVATQTLNLTGGTTVYALSDRMIEIYRQAGFVGEINIEDIGTGNGFERFCETGDADLVNASRLVKDDERALCAANDRALIAFPVGLDLVVVVVSQQNPFIDQVSFRQLNALLTSALRWSDVDPTWPDEFITRAIPNKSRGTFSFFVEMLYAGVSSEPATIVQPAIVQPAIVTLARTPIATPDSDPTAIPSLLSTATATTATASTAVTNVSDGPVDYTMGYLPDDATCTLATEVMQGVLAQEFGYTVSAVPFASTAALFDALSSTNNKERIDWTLCYSGPAAAHLETYANKLSLIGTPYYQSGTAEYQTVIYSAMRWVLRQERPCVFSLLSNFTLDAQSLDGVNAASWRDEHQELIQSWASCR